MSDESALLPGLERALELTRDLPGRIPSLIADEIDRVRAHRPRVEEACEEVQR